KSEPSVPQRSLPAGAGAQDCPWVGPLLPPSPPSPPSGTGVGFGLGVPGAGVGVEGAGGAGVGVSTGGATTGTGTVTVGPLESDGFVGSSSVIVWQPKNANSAAPHSTALPRPIDGLPC